MHDIDDHIFLVRRFIESSMRHAEQAEGHTEDKAKWERINHYLAQALVETYPNEPEPIGIFGDSSYHANH